MKKYNIAIHILFWILVVFLLSIVAFSLSSENDKIGSLLPFLKSAELPEKENVESGK